MSKETTPYFQHHFVDPEQQDESSKLGMWAFLVTEVLTFAGFFVHMPFLERGILKCLLMLIKLLM